MYDKIAKSKGYIQNFKHDLDDICFSCSNLTKTIILVNVNSPYIKEILLSELSSCDVQVITATTDDIAPFGTLGGFLRHYKSYSLDKKRTLILDFAYDFSHLSVNEAADIINSNRDLFTLSFDSVVILVNPRLAANLRYYAADFWSCVNIHMDTSKWYSTPITLPIVKLRINANTEEQIIKWYKKNKNNYSIYFELASKINNFKEFDPQMAQLLLEQIFSVPHIVVQVFLINAFTNKMISIKTKPEYVEKKCFIFKNLLSKVNDSLEYIDVVFLCSEFFLKSEKYIDAMIGYQKAMQLLENEWDDYQKTLINYFLSCNILICKYMQQKTHNPQNLLQELKERLLIFQNDLLGDDLHLANNYLYLVYCASRHHSIVEHKEIIENLRENFVCSTPIIDFSESYRIQLLWEEFILNDFVPRKKHTKQPIYSLHLYIQQMVHNFIIGDYERTRYAYKHAVWLAKNYGYMDILKLIKVYYENIVFINEKFRNR